MKDPDWIGGALFAIASLIWFANYVWLRPAFWKMIGLLSAVAWAALFFGSPTWAVMTSVVVAAFLAMIAADLRSDFRRDLRDFDSAAEEDEEPRKALYRRALGE